MGTSYCAEWVFTSDGVYKKYFELVFFIFASSLGPQIRLKGQFVYDDIQRDFPKD